MKRPMNDAERTATASRMDRILENEEPDLRKLARHLAHGGSTGRQGTVFCSECGTLMKDDDGSIAPNRPGHDRFHRDAHRRWCGPLRRTDAGNEAAIPPGTAYGSPWLNAVENAAKLARAVAEEHEPDLHVRRGKDGQGPIYLQRWWLERMMTPNGGEFGYYIHRFLHDDDAGLHDHPWPSASLLLDGRLHETLESHTWTIETGTRVLRSSGLRHRLVLDRDANGGAIPAHTLIATGAREKSWELEHEDGEIEVIGTSERKLATRTTVHKCST